LQSHITSDDEGGAGGARDKDGRGLPLPLIGHVGGELVMPPVLAFAQYEGAAIFLQDAIAIRR